jgi:protein-disulfide isomerase
MADKETTKGERNSTRNRTIERRRERQREEQRQRQLYIVGGLVVAAVVIAAIFLLANQPAEAPLPSYSAARYENIPVSRSSDGFPQLGNPDAPVKVVEYSSFGCPACRVFHESSMDGIVARVRSGDILFTYVPMYAPGSLSNRQGAAEAAVCAADQGQFWPYHDALFAWAATYANQAFTQARMTSGANALGLDMGTFSSCLGGSQAANIVETAERVAQSNGVTGTPTISVNGVNIPSASLSLVEINTRIDEALQLAGIAPGSRPLPTADSTPQATSEAP